MSNKGSWANHGSFGIWPSLVSLGRKKQSGQNVKNEDYNGVIFVEKLSNLYGEDEYLETVIPITE